MLKIGISGLAISGNKRSFCLDIFLSCVYKSRQVSSIVKYIYVSWYKYSKRYMNLISAVHNNN